MKKTNASIKCPKFLEESETPVTSVSLAQFSSFSLGSSPTDRTEGSLGRQRLFEKRVLFINYVQMVQFLTIPKLLRFSEGKNFNHRSFQVDFV